MTPSPPRLARTAAAVLAPVLLVLVVAVVLVPAGSAPVGWDVWWNLLVARTWADSGFPGAMPQAAFTSLAEHYGDRQILFHGVLAWFGGADLGPGHVPAFVWAFAGLNGAALVAGLVLVRRGTSPLWALLLPALSATWLFRATALRDMLLGAPLLVLLLAVLAARAAGRRVPLPVAGGLAALFTYGHGAAVLPVVVALLALAGRRLETGRWSWREPLAVLAGVAFACVARPDFPHNLEVLATLNLGMPFAAATEAVPLRPTEFLPLTVDEWLRWELPFLVAVAAAVVLLVRRPARERPWTLAVPVLLMVVAALFSRRMLELAVPAVVLLLGRCGPASPRWFLLLLLALPWQAYEAGRSAAANRVDLQGVGQWLVERGQPGDLVFVTDWGATSPLAWWTRGAGLRFTGVIDPVLMWAEDPGAWRDWLAVKTGGTDNALEVITGGFGARFLVFQASDPAADRLRREVREAAGAGSVHDMVLPRRPGEWAAFDLGR